MLIVSIYIICTFSFFEIMKTFKQLIETLGVQPTDLAAYASLDEEFRVLKKAYFKKASN